MTAHDNVSAPAPMYRTIDSRWLLGSFALGLLLATSVSLASPGVAAPAKQGRGRVLVAAPVHRAVQSGKVLAELPRFSAHEIHGRPNASTGMAR